MVFAIGAAVCALVVACAAWRLAPITTSLAVAALAVVIGFFTPAEVVVVSMMALLVAALYVMHAARVHHAIHDPTHPDHAAIMRGLHRYRERRGF